MTSVSVAMATYNGARFLAEQLTTIAAQSVLPAELVITDDASTDDTLEIVARFAAKAPFPVRMHRNESRLGYRANFVRNIGLCTSEIIALCDQDDVWDTSKLARALGRFDHPDILLCYHESWLIDSAGHRTGLARIYPLPDTNPPLSLWPLRNPYGFSMLFRRELLGFSDLWEKSRDNLEPQHRMAHDQWLFFLASVFGTIAHISEPLAGYRQHANNTYGVGLRGGTRWNRISRWVDAATTEYRHFGFAAETRAMLLDEAQRRVPEPWRSRARIAAESYRDLARHCLLRSSAYTAPDVLTGLGAWFTLLREGAYAGSRWSFGRKTALKDLSWLLLPRPVARALPLTRFDMASGARVDAAPGEPHP